MARTKAFDEQEVLQRAMCLFWKKGFHATSIQDLVDYIGINRASIYDTYGGKTELFEKAFQQYRENNIEELKIFLYSHESVRDGIRAMFKRIIEESACDIDRKGCFVVNTTTELAPTDEKMTKILAENKNQIEELLYNYLQKGVERGEISSQKDLKSIAAYIFTLYGGIQVINKVNMDTTSQYKMLETALSVLD